MMEPGPVFSIKVPLTMATIEDPRALHMAMNQLRHELQRLRQDHQIYQVDLEVLVRTVV